MKKMFYEIFAGADKQLLLFISFLLAIGIMFVFSASVPTCMNQDESVLKYLILHCGWIFMGILGMLFFANFDYKKLKKYTFLFAIGVIVMLLLVKFTPLGVTINGARRWLDLGFIQFQPSELSKMALIMLLSYAFSLTKRELKHHFWTFLIPIFTMIFIVYKQPNLSMTMLLLGIAFCMYICSGKTLKWVFLLLGVSILLLFGIKYGVVNVDAFLEPFQKDRILKFLDREADLEGGNYQVFHSLIAISSGGIIGSGYGSSKEKLGYIPESHTDFIFSVIGEEMGFLGVLFVIGLFWLLFHKGLVIAFRCPDLYGRLMAVGISISITMQAFFNMCVTTGLLPATGMTLPFISYGGSSLFVSLCMIGVLLNISRKRV